MEHGEGSNTQVTPHNILHSTEKRKQEHSLQDESFKTVQGKEVLKKQY